MKPWFLYVVRTIDGFLYAGISTDVRRRFKEHMAQGRKTPRYLLAHKPQRLVFSLAVGSRRLTLKVEYRFKQLPKAAKEEIVGSGQLQFDCDTGRIRYPQVSTDDSLAMISRM